MTRQGEAAGGSESSRQKLERHRLRQVTEWHILTKMYISSLTVLLVVKAPTIQL